MRINIHSSNLSGIALPETVRQTNEKKKIAGSESKSREVDMKLSTCLFFFFLYIYIWQNISSLLTELDRTSKFIDMPAQEIN